MSLDVFGRRLDSKSKVGGRGPPGVGYKLTMSGDYDIEKRRICNLSSPIDPNDAVNFQALELNIAASGERFTELLNSITEAVKKREERIEKLEKTVDEIKKLKRKPILSFRDVM